MPDVAKKDVTLSAEDLIGAYRTLSGMMQEHMFDNRMLNLAIMKNCRRLEDEAERLLAERRSIFEEYAETWSEDEDRPEGAEPGALKMQTVPGGGQQPRFPSAEAKEAAQAKISTLFEPNFTFEAHVVPYEAMDTDIEGVVMADWYPLEWMFDDGDDG